MDAKLITAALAAGVGVTIAAWVLTDQIAGGRDARSATAHFEAADPDDTGDAPPPGGPRRRPGGPPGEAPQWERPPETPEGGWSFPDAGSPEEAVAALDEGIVSVQAAVQANAALGSLAGASKLGLVESWRTFLAPVLGGDEAGFAGAVAALGGVVGENGELAGSLYRQLNGLLGSAGVDTDAVSTERVGNDDPREVPAAPAIGGAHGEQTGVPVMVEVSRTRDDGTGEETERYAMQIPLGAVFPDAARAREAGAPTVRVWAPARMPGARGDAPDCGVATYLVWTADRARWSPVAVRLTLETDHAKDALRTAMRRGRDGAGG